MSAQAVSAPKSEAITESMKLLKSTSYGVMATISVAVPGYPFGSHMPYCVDDEGNLLVYISTLAQHTKNLDANSKCSVTIVSPNYGHIQNSARLTFIGDASRTSGEEFEEAFETYIRHFPKAKRYKEMHDFHIYKVRPVRLRYIGGFGKIFWVEKDEYLNRAIFSKDAKLSIIQHMNEDHKDFMKKILVKNNIETPSDNEEVRMVDIDKLGISLMIEDRRYFVPFENFLQNENEAKDAIISLGK